MSIVVKRYTFDAAHILPLHKGKCKNLHGHTYQVEVHIKGQVDESTGMIVDFGQISHIVKPIIEGYDHSFIRPILGQDISPSVENLYRLCIKWGWKLKHMDYPQSTAEFIAQQIQDEIIFRWQIEYKLVRLNKGKLWVKVAIWETPTSYARTNWEVLNESE